MAGVAKSNRLPTVAMLMESSVVNYSPTADKLKGLAGAAIGASVGEFICGWLISQGFYAVALPGVLLGVGAGLLRQRQSLAFSVACGFVALILGIFTEWRHFPYVTDESLGYFLLHLPDLRPVTMIMIALGAFAGFWFSRRSRSNSSTDSKSQPEP